MLVDAAVHASGASKKWLISLFIPASAAKREKYEIRVVDKKVQWERNKAKTVQARVHREAILYSEN